MINTGWARRALGSPPWYVPMITDLAPDRTVLTITLTPRRRLPPSRTVMMAPWANAGRVYR
jgi:hypothetical protein